MNEKDVSMTVCGLLKSVIESGAAKEDWLDLTGQALRVHYAWKNQLMQPPPAPAADADTEAEVPDEVVTSVGDDLPE